VGLNIGKAKAVLFIVIFTMLGCAKDSEERNNASSSNYPMIPTGFPEPNFPEDNPFSEASYELGKKLFFDPILSKDSSISCGSCHSPGRAFADNNAFSMGVEGRLGSRNTPSLANVAYHPHFTREGGVPSLEMQVLVPIQEHNEFDFNIVLIAERLAYRADYIELAERAYGREPDPFVIVRSLANFERTLISGNSPFDQYYFQGLSNALNAAERRGMDLFFSDSLACSSCHGGFDFTDYSFRNNGLYLNYADSGRMRLTGLESDRALFKVPSLRNVEVTAPYMHDGSIESLEEVIEHYQSGGASHPNKSTLIKGFKLNPQEVQDLVGFLETLTDHEFLNNQRHNP
jgi:cytochrome c peroxidase